VVPVLPAAAAAAGAAAASPAAGSPSIPSRPEHQQEPPGGGPQPEQAADELAPAAAAQAVHVGRRAPTAARRALDDVVVVQLVEHRQLAKVGGGRRSGALGGRGQGALRLAPAVLLVGLGHIYAVPLEELGALWDDKSGEIANISGCDSGSVHNKLRH